MAKAPAEVRGDLITPVQSVMQLRRGSNLGVVDARRVTAIVHDPLLELESWAEAVDPLDRPCH
jgi:hypothetical protein